MGYPVLARSRTEDYVYARRSNAILNGPPEHELRGGDDDCYDDITNEALKSVMDAWRDGNPAGIAEGKKDGVTGELAVLLYEGLRELPGSVLSDGDFWRYCSAYLYDLVEWRMGANCNLKNYGAFSSSVRDCLPHDMFQRAHIAYLGGAANGDPNPFKLAGLSSSDVWRSHILRVLTGNAPVVVHELLVEVAAGKLKTDKVREVAKNLKRARANVLFEVLDPLQARQLLEREMAREGS